MPGLLTIFKNGRKQQSFKVGIQKIVKKNHHDKKFKYNMFYDLNLNNLATNLYVNTKKRL